MQKGKRDISIWWGPILFSLPVLLVTTALLAAMAGSTFDDIDVYIDERGELSSGELAAHINYAIQSDPSSIEWFVERHMSKYSDIVEVEVLDVDGNILVSQSAEPPGRNRYLPWPQVVFTQEHFELFSTPLYRGLDVNGVPYGPTGVIHVTMSQDLIVNNLMEATRAVISILIIMVFFLTLTTFFITRIFFQYPLSKLHMAQQLIRERGESNTLDKLDFDHSLIREFNQLNEGFLSMASSIRDHQAIQKKKIKAATEELRVQNNQLVIANEKAQSAEKAKGDFVAQISHEFRTPMNAIMGFAQLLSASELKNRQYSYVKEIEDATLNLLGMVDDVLDFSKLEAEKFPIVMGDVDVIQIVDAVADRFSIQATMKSINLNVILCDAGPMISVTDQKAIFTILNNFVSNAIKFTHEGSVNIRISKLESIGKIRIDVEDDGPGVEESKLREIFQPFYQVANKDALKIGTGLGLSIANNFIGLIGAELDVSSPKGEGLKLGLLLPLSNSKKSAYQDYLKQVESSFKRAMVITTLDDVGVALVSKLRYLGVPAFCQSSIQPPLFGCDLLILHYKNFEDVKNISLKTKESFGAKYMVVMTDYLSDRVCQQLEGVEGVDLVASTHLGVRPLADIMSELLMIDSHDEPPAGELSLLNSTKFSDLKRGDFHVLCVDDVDSNQRLNREILELVGVNATFASDGIAAVELARENVYDCILMDLHMPVMDGREAIEEIKENSLNEKTPIFIVTASVAAKHDDELNRLARGVIVKPIVPEDLAGKLLDLNG